MDKEWVLAMGGFALFAALEAWSNSRQCRLVGAIGVSFVVWAAMIALIRFLQLIDRFLQKKRRRNAPIWAASIASIVLWVGILNWLTSKVGQALHCAW